MLIQSVLNENCLVKKLLLLLEFISNKALCLRALKVNYTYHTNSWFEFSFDII